MTSAQLLEQARQLHAAGQLPAAEQLYRQILATEPDHASALNLLGALALQVGQPQPAIDLLRRAIAADPNLPDAHNHLGAALAALGQVDSAIESHRRALQLNPDYPEAHYNIALLLAKAGQPESAITHFRRALSLRPNYAKAHNDLASALKSLGNTADATTHYRHAITANPNFPEAHYNLGVTLAEQQLLEEAATSYRTALRLRPAFPEALNNLATALFGLGQLSEAAQAARESLKLLPDQAQTRTLFGTILLRNRDTFGAAAAFHASIALQPSHDAYFGLSVAFHENGVLKGAIEAARSAIAINPTVIESQSHLASLLLESDRIDEARTQLQSALEIIPDSERLQFMLAALTGEATATSAPDAHITSLFDYYASRFDSHLVHTLHYRGPEFLRDAIAAVAPNRTFDILDLGCGTGLCGLALQPVAKSLVGVDLSPNMVERCRARGIYTHVHVSDFQSILRQTLAGYDLITAADVFGYVGDLDSVFAAAAAALRPQGFFAFTSERCDRSDFVLQPTLRFAHSLDYLRRLAQRHHFTESHLAEQPLRTHAHQPVPAWIVVLQK